MLCILIYDVITRGDKRMQVKRHNYIRMNMLVKRDLSNMLGNTLNENPKL